MQVQGVLYHLNVIQGLLKGTEHVLRLKQLVHQFVTRQLIE